MRQSDMSVLKLFKLWFESIFQKMKLGKMEVNINEYLNLLWFTDNILLLSRSLDKLQEMLNELNRKSISVMNRNKTNAMVNYNVPTKIIWTNPGIHCLRTNDNFEESSWKCNKIT